jgi:hypothetical protein
VLTAVNVTPANPQIPVGSSVQLTAKGLYSDNSTKDLSSQVAWSSSLTKVAQVSTSGSVSAMSAGSANISATLGKINGTALVVVQPPVLVKIAIAPTSNSLPAGESQQMAATGTYSDGSTADISATATWTSSNSNVVGVSSTGEASALSPGTATISAAVDNITGTSPFTVTAAVVTSLTVAPTIISLPLGEARQVTATASYSDGSTNNVTTTAAWISTGNAVAQVNAGGMVSAMGVGSAIVSASLGSTSASAQVTVTRAAVVSISIAPGSATVPLGSLKQLHAVGNLSDGTTQDVTGAATWQTSDSTTVAVTSGGMVLAEQIGSSTVTADYDSLSGSADVTVLPLVSSSYFDRSSASSTGSDGTIRLSNPGLTQGDLCALVYVFDESQQLAECCGCRVTDDGLRTLSLGVDLTANPLTGTRPKRGTITVVPSSIAASSSCDASVLVPSGLVVGWAANGDPGGGNGQATESTFQNAPLSTGELNALQTDCQFIEKLGSGHGICTCGTGD